VLSSFLIDEIVLGGKIYYKDGYLREETKGLTYNDLKEKS
jgi:hypothetical protein